MKRHRPKALYNQLFGTSLRTKITLMSSVIKGPDSRIFTIMEKPPLTPERQKQKAGVDMSVTTVHRILLEHTVGAIII